MAMLNGTVTPKEGDGIAVLVRKELNFQVTGLARKLHDEDRRSRNFSCNGMICVLEKGLLQS